MSDLEDGQYLIVLAATSAPPPFAIGANHEDGPASPVISGANDTIVSPRFPISASNAISLPSFLHDELVC